MDVPSIVQLTRCATGAKEDARIETLSRELAKNHIDAVWWTGLDTTLRDPGAEPDRHWEWRVILSKSQNNPYYWSKCVKSSDGYIEGAMLYRVDAMSALSTDQRAISIERLAAAPRNRDKLVQAPVFRGAGTGLLIHAVAQSYSLGFQGRINLIAVANEPFYTALGFIPTNITADGDVLFEMPVVSALELLKKRGLIDD